MNFKRQEKMNKWAKETSSLKPTEPVPEAQREGTKRRKCVILVERQPGQEDMEVTSTEKELIKWKWEE